ncbi:unnamed protein product [Schistocephalus solidus]|uniref:DNA helicase n=1 Tax=Schistocephalus solidus TaxID=70667 RepID=A0A183TAT0_SCHSO|nr:unnamed protein product [Schistocephalus solidus]
MTPQSCPLYGDHTLETRNNVAERERLRPHPVTDGSNDGKNDLYEELLALLEKADKLIVLGDLDVRVDLCHAVWEEFLGHHGL